MDFDKPEVYGDTSITDGLVYLRVDPSALLENQLSKEETIWEIALLCYWESPELLNTLSDFKEIPEDVKLLKLSKMICLREDERLGGKDNLEQLKEEFLKTLQSLSSLETVKIFYHHSICFSFLGEHEGCEGWLWW